MITPYLMEVQIKISVSVINHDHIKLCQDRELPKWLLKARHRRDAHTRERRRGNSRSRDAHKRGRRSRSLVVQMYESGRGLREQRSGNPAGPGRERIRYGDDGPGFHACERGDRRHDGLRQSRGSYIHGDGRSQFLQPTSVASVGSQTDLQIG
ncbi:hypothetical protein PoB_000361500 [Plakobranchus ocellatus]|uniref:Uncharacterized protein n=1 Tax=Plakobranchus ocellatus TaxID=259542 RepID=A0AAV3Y366_9GAST|nr:hypothetical protein PoB_000361500 [Plakobranchus ocellatus]